MKIEGLDEIVKNMQAIAKDLKGDPLRASLRKGLNVIRDQARTNAPRGETGRLAPAINTRPLPADDVPSNATDGQELFVASSRKKDADAPGNAWYWHFVEFGTKKMPARPFLAPAFDSRKQAAIDEFVNEMRKQLERNVKRIAKT